MRKITMMEFRSMPGEFVHEVYRHGKIFIITKMGKPVAQLSPLDSVVILSNGKCIGGIPITKSKPELLR